MSRLICELDGARGRRIAVYDNKCVITTDVSLGSIVTSNALDGQKTIFYIDVQGIQFKKSGLALGYLQLETGSIQMNNSKSNMFSENTFTFADTFDGVLNAFMEKIHDYIVDRIESYKYRTDANQKYLYDLVAFASKITGCYVEPGLLTQLKREEQEQEILREQERAERQRQEREAQQREIEDFRCAIQDKDLTTQINMFLAQAATCTRVLEVLELWKNFEWESCDATAMIEKKINGAAQVERMYGRRSNGVQTLLEDIKTIM